jgi:uridylate kinase
MQTPTSYKRVLLKLSGEQFAGDRDYGVDPNFVNRLSKELAETIEATGVQLAIIVGGGNIMRGASVAKSGIERATGDYMGMLATLINGMALVDILEANGVAARLQTRLEPTPSPSPTSAPRLAPPRKGESRGCGRRHRQPLRHHRHRRRHHRPRAGV